MPKQDSTLAHVLAIVGLTPYNSLCAAFEGLSIKVNDGKSPHMRKVKGILGEKLHALFVHTFQNTHIYFPLKKTAEREQRNKAIRKEFAQLTKTGHSKTASLQYLAQKNRLSERTLRTIVQG